MNQDTYNFNMDMPQQHRKNMHMKIARTISKRTGEVATTLIIGSLVVMGIGMLIGNISQRRVAITSQARCPADFTSGPRNGKDCANSNIACGLRIIKDTFKIKEVVDENGVPTGDVDIRGNICYTSNLTSGAHQGLLSVTTEHPGKAACYKTLSTWRHSAFHPGDHPKCDQTGTWAVLNPKTAIPPRFKEVGAQNYFSMTVKRPKVGEPCLSLNYYTMGQQGGGGAGDNNSILDMGPLVCPPTGATPTPTPTCAPGVSCPTATPSPTCAPGVSCPTATPSPTCAPGVSCPTATPTVTPTVTPSPTNSCPAVTTISGKLVIEGQLPAICTTQNCKFKVFACAPNPKDGGQSIECRSSEGGATYGNSPQFASGPEWKYTISNVPTNIAKVGVWVERFIYDAAGNRIVTLPWDQEALNCATSSRARGRSISDCFIELNKEIACKAENVDFKLKFPTPTGPLCPENKGSITGTVTVIGNLPTVCTGQDCRFKVNICARKGARIECNRAQGGQTYATAITGAGPQYQFTVTGVPVGQEVGMYVNRGVYTPSGTLLELFNAGLVSALQCTGGTKVQGELREYCFLQVPASGACSIEQNYQVDFGTPPTPQAARIKGTVQVFSCVEPEYVQVNICESDTTCNDPVAVRHEVGNTPNVPNTVWKIKSLPGPRTNLYVYEYLMTKGPHAALITAGNSYRMPGSIGHIMQSGRRTSHYSDRPIDKYVRPALPGDNIVDWTIHIDEYCGNPTNTPTPSPTIAPGDCGTACSTSNPQQCMPDLTCRSEFYHPIGAGNCWAARCEPTPTLSPTPTGVVGGKCQEACRTTGQACDSDLECYSFDNRLPGITPFPCDPTRFTCHNTRCVNPLNPSSQTCENPTLTPTNSPTPTPGLCKWEATDFVKEKMPDGTLRVMDEIDQDNVKYFTMNDEQRKRHGDGIIPPAPAAYGYRFKDGINYVSIAKPESDFWPVVVASNDERGLTYQYARGEYACVKLYYDSATYNIVGQEIPTLTIDGRDVRVQPFRRTDDEICGLPFACNLSYKYGWILERKPNIPTPTGSSCPIQVDECTPRNFTVEEVKEQTTNVEWDAPRACPQFNPGEGKDVYWILVREGQNGPVVSSRGPIGDHDTGVKARDNYLSRVQKSITAWQPGITYYAYLYAYQEGSAPECKSPPAIVPFTRDGEDEPTNTPTPGPVDGDLKTQQIDWILDNKGICWSAWSDGSCRIAPNSAKEWCESSADTRFKCKAPETFINGGMVSQIMLKPDQSPITINYKSVHCSMCHSIPVPGSNPAYNASYCETGVHGDAQETDNGTYTLQPGKCYQLERTNASGRNLRVTEIGCGNALTSTCKNKQSGGPNTSNKSNNTPSLTTLSVPAIFNIANNGSNVVSEVTAKLCEKGSSICEQAAKVVNIGKGQNLRFEQLFTQLQNNRLNATKRYTVSATLKYTDGNTAQLPERELGIDNPLRFNVDIAADSKVNSTTVTERQAADCDKDGVPTAKDLSFMYANWGSDKCDVNGDGRTDSSDGSIGIKWNDISVD